MIQAGAVQVPAIPAGGQDDPHQPCTQDPPPQKIPELVDCLLEPVLTGLGPLTQNLQMVSTMYLPSQFIFKTFPIYIFQE